MKKTEVVTIRIDADTKKKIEDRANKREWSIAQTCAKILQNHYQTPDKNYYLEDLVPHTVEISKHNEEVLYELSTKLNISMDEALNYIINYFAIQYPIDYFEI